MRKSRDVASTRARIDFGFAAPVSLGESYLITTQRSIAALAVFDDLPENTEKLSPHVLVFADVLGDLVYGYYMIRYELTKAQARSARYVASREANALRGIVYIQTPTWELLPTMWHRK